MFEGGMTVGESGVTYRTQAHHKLQRVIVIGRREIEICAGFRAYCCDRARKCD